MIVRFYPLSELQFYLKCTNELFSKAGLSKHFLEILEPYYI